MWNRWFLMAVIAVLTLLLGLLIYIDSREALYPAEVSSRQDSHGISRSATPSSPDSANYAPQLSASELQRINYVTSVLDTLRSQREQLPYLGELIQVYERAGQYQKAADFSAERAVITDQAGDWLEAGTLKMQAVRSTGDDILVEQGAYLALEYFSQALRLRPDDPDINTDLAVVHMSLLQPERSRQILRDVIEKHPDHVRATFNMAVLMHQTGRTDESVTYFERALALSDDGEWARRVQQYLDDFHHHTIHQ